MSSSKTSISDVQSLFTVALEQREEEPDVPQYSYGSIIFSWLCLEGFLDILADATLTSSFPDTPAALVVVHRMLTREFGSSTLAERMLSCELGPPRESICAAYWAIRLMVRGPTAT